MKLFKNDRHVTNIFKLSIAYSVVEKSEVVQSEVAKSLLALAEQKSSASQGTSQDKGIQMRHFQCTNIY